MCVTEVHVTHRYFTSETSQEHFLFLSQVHLCSNADGTGLSPTEMLDMDGFNAHLRSKLRSEANVDICWLLILLYIYTECTLKSPLKNGCDREERKRNIKYLDDTMSDLIKTDFCQHDQI